MPSPVMARVEAHTGTPAAALEPGRADFAWWMLGWTLLGLALRIFRIDHQSLWIDEFLMIRRASLGEPFLWADVFVNPQGPLPALLLRVWTSAFGTGEAALRMPSALAGALTIPVVMALGRRLHPHAGLWAGGLAAFSPFLIWYSQETRHYALAILGAALAHLAFLRLLEGEKGLRIRLFYGGSLWLGLMSNMTVVFLAAAHGATLLAAHRERLREWTLAVLPAFLLLSPWLWVTLSRNVNLEHVTAIGPIPVEERLRGETTFSWFGVPYTAFVFFAGYSLGPTLVELHDAPRLATVAPHLPLVLPLAVAAAWFTLRGGLSPTLPRGGRWLIALAFLLPLAAVLLLSARNAKVFNARYMAISLPLILATTAVGLAREDWRRPVRALALLAAFVAPTFLALGNYYFDPRYFREDMRAAGRFLSAEARAEDRILGLGAPQLLEWYYHGAAPVEIAYDVWIRDTVGLPTRIDRWAEGRSTLWLCVSRPWLQDPEGRLEKALAARFGAGERIRFPGVTLYRFVVGSDHP